ncbi:Rhodanese-related sulfurtransferase [Flavobacterium sp. 9AF]|uniref:rhodanese-like domain-containing protein n=1 Tax=Flavobacterium sp. 9AF TaxID=2653142 RepID=UPI0012F18A46|nr:rhodanese-like domain-containing protein [Flavobacterium sp. 9AF]VXB97193.1 Rhodanese-related sulfurtransferase [Flavobacterium sp. 9AF]
MKTFFIIILIFVVLYGSFKTFLYVTKEPQLISKIKNGAIILDVRTSSECKKGHIKGAIIIPLGELRTRYVELDTSVTYITCCSHGLRSVKAVNILKERGFKKVCNGGAWEELQSQIIQSNK